MFSIYGDSVLKFVLLEDNKYKSNHDGDQLLERAFGQKLVNRSCFGSTVTKGLKRLQFDLDSGKNPGSCCIVEFGGNDCSYDWAAVAEAPQTEHDPYTKPEEFVERLKNIIALIRGAGSTPVLTNLVPMVPGRYFEWITRTLPRPQAVMEWVGDLGHFYRQNEYYSLLCARVAREEQVKLVDIRSPFLWGNHMERLFCMDGIHPNREGHAMIFQTLCRFGEKEVGLA